MEIILNKTLLLGGSVVALLILVVIFFINESNKIPDSMINDHTKIQHRIFKVLTLVTIVELILEIGVFILGFLGQDDNNLTELMFVPRLYLFSFIVWTAVFSCYVLSVSLRRANFRKIWNSRMFRCLSYAILAIVMCLFMILPMTAVNNGLTYYGKGILVDAIVVPVIIASEISWVAVILRHKDRFSRKFVPVVAVVVLLMVAIIIRFIDNGLLIFGLIHSVVIIVGILTIDNKNQIMLEAEARARRAEERENAIKDEFLNLASHQLRTPLTSISGYASMLLEGDFGKLRDDQEKAIEEIAGSSRRMTYIVADLLNVSRIRGKRFVIQRAYTDLGQLIKKESTATAVLAESHQVAVSLDPINDNLPEIFIDGPKVSEVIANMLDNAIFYSPAGETVTISLKKSGNNLEFRVKDRGIGVPKKEQDRLFTKFYRASNARTKRPDGTGIGLYLAKRIIEEHGGEIIFESAEGEGSTFGFKLPVHSPKDPSSP